MYVSPVSLNGSSFNPYIRSILNPRKTKQVDSTDQIFSTINPSTVEENNSIPWWETKPNSIFSALLAFATATYSQVQKEEKLFGPTYMKIYLQYPNDRLQRLADEITHGLNENDDKATAIIRWVLENFPYETDKVNYGYEELWIPPTIALQTGSGDCEDGAFLVHSLLLHAGIKYDRIRTYGGYVDAGTENSAGGHAWTAYKRESDDEWVVLDTSYYSNTKDVTKRTPMRKRSIYTENYFYFNQLYWVNTVDIDRIHNPEMISTYNVNAMLDNKLKLAGWLIDNYG